MNTDIQIRDDIQRELFYNSGINAASIGVAVRDGVVTLSGTVDTYAQKLEAVRAAERIPQVKAVACQLSVRLTGPAERTDADLARASANVLAWNSRVPPDRIRLTVENSWIRLDGTVDWQYQKDAAGEAVAHLWGVKGIDNRITVNPLASVEKTKELVQAALQRCGIAVTQNVLVEVTNDQVALYGEVRSIAERQAAERIAWEIPGIADVANHLAVCQPAVRPAKAAG